MRLAPKSTALRIATYLLGGLIVGAALIALLPSSNQSERVGTIGSISSEETVVASPEPASQQATETTESASASTATTQLETESSVQPLGEEADESNSADTATDSDAGLDPDLLSLPTTAADLAASLNQVEAAVRDDSLSNIELDAWGRRQQALYRHLSFHPEWADESLAAIDPVLADAVNLNWQARQSLSSLVNTEKLHDELPAWRLNPPLPPEELIGYYKQAEADTGIQWEFLAAINLIETRMGRIEGVSTAGALGPMQFLPTTWAECCQGDPTVPADAIAGAAKYLTVRGGPENMDKAIFGYNNSDYYVNAVTSYANVMMENERAYYGYHAWEVYFLSTEGLIRIPVGYEQLEPIAATAWLAENPDTLFAP